jgi:hypothetical protein
MTGEFRNVGRSHGALCRQVPLRLATNAAVFSVAQKVVASSPKGVLRENWAGELGFVARSD